MKNKKRIEIFKPSYFEKAQLDMEHLNGLFNKKLLYASMGRNALFHILKSLNVSEKILIPAYICGTVLEPIKKLNLTPVFYDLEESDLNASLESIDFLSKKHKVKSVLVASLYGNPANLDVIEKYCNQNGLKLVDDAAQSFGASVGGRMTGSFGNAGFFSFSPGKPTAGHMGAFFWSENEDYLINRTKHFLYHYVSYLDFYFNRYNVYKYRSFLLFKYLSLLKSTLYKVCDIADDAISNFEKPILGGIIDYSKSEKTNYRQRYFNEFTDRYANNQYFRIIRAVRGTPNNHKIVIMALNKDIAKRFILHLNNYGIYCSNGYSLLTNNLKYLPQCSNVRERIIEMPIENDSLKMNYLFSAVKDFKEY